MWPETHLPAASVSEFLTFFTKTVAERTSSGQRQSVEENNYTAHAYSRGADSVTGIVVTDKEYPIRVAFSLLNKILDDFLVRVPPGPGGRWSPSDSAVQNFKPALDEFVRKYQDPKQADTIMKVQQELDETKIELVRCLIVLSRCVAHLPGK
jgi:synaptobrevin family protein YKT6